MMNLKELLWTIRCELKPTALTHRKALSYCKKHFNELGLYGGHEITRLVGFGEGDDLYFLLRSSVYNFETNLFGFKDVYCSMVGWWYSLKGIGKKAYSYTERNAVISKAEKFSEKYWHEEFYEL